MALAREPENLDSKFYKTADDFFPAHNNIGLTFDDITLATLYSEVLPHDTQLDTTLAEGLSLNIPVISADMDTVTESRMATAMALNGGLGLIHYNMPDRQQLSEVSRVKYHVPGLIQDPIQVTPDQLVGDVLKLIEERKFVFSTFPVADAKGKLVGLLSGHVVKPRYAKRKVAEAMTPRAQVHTVNRKELGKDPIARADQFFTERPGIHKLLVVDDDDHLRGLFTMSDVERIAHELVRGDLNWVLDEAGDGVFDAADFGELLPVGHVVVDEAQPAVERHRSGHARFRHRVHVGGDDRDVQAQALGELRVEQRIARENLRVKRGQRDVVKRQADVVVSREKVVGSLVKPGIEAAGIFRCCHVGECRPAAAFGKRRIGVDSLAAGAKQQHRRRAVGIFQ